MPHTITFAISYRQRIESFYELPKEKRPPRNLWDKPYQLEEYFDDLFDSKGSGGSPSQKGKTYIDYNPDEVEG